MSLRQELDVVDGPSDMGLMASLFVRIDGKKPTVDFTLHSMTPYRGVNNVKVEISGVDEEDRSGDNWNFRGYMQTPGDPNRWSQINGYFNIRRRKGYINIPL